MSMRKFTGIGLALAFTSCSIAYASAQDLTLRVDAAASIYADMFNDLARTFEAANPGIKISMDTSERDQNSAFQKTMRLALVGDLPDVSFQGPVYLKTLVERQIIQPLDGLISSDSNWTEDSYSPSITRSTKIDGKTMGLGVAYSFPIIYYNVDLVREAQDGNATLPADWDGILGVAKKVQELHPDALGIYAQFRALYSQSLIRSGGGRLGDETGTKVLLSDPKTLAGLELFQRIGEAGQAANAMSGDQARQSFSAGKIAIQVDSSSSLRRFLTQSEGLFDLATATLPLDAEDGELSTSGFAVVLHTKDKERQDAAWRFMRFVASPEGETILGTKTGFVPGNEAAVHPSGQLGNYYASIPQMQAVLDSIPVAGPWYLFRGANDERIEALLDDYIESIIMQKISPQDAARELTGKIGALVE